ncbi:MAG: co-chaperone GroES family protein [Candidatus Nanopelagicaceae bacterium]|jgi:co-chaperonin GroES (HSP10)
MSKNKNDFQPVGDRVLIQRDAGEKKTESGLVLPNEKKSNTATLIAIGDGEKISKNLTIGSRVYFVEHPQQLPIGDKYLLIPSEAIMGVISE